MKYTDYLDFKLKIPMIAVAAHRRAVRNCPWVSLLWEGLLNAVERSGADVEAYVKVFDEALKGGFAGKEAYLGLLVTRCDFYRRRVHDWSADVEKVGELQKSFESGIQYMEHYFGVEGDAYCVLLRERAFVEAKHLGNLKGAQELWDMVMKKHSRNSRMWTEYLKFLNQFTDIATIRRAFQRAVQVAFENPTSIGEEYLKFERRNGSLSDVDAARQKINLQARKAKERKERDAAREAENGDGGEYQGGHNNRKSKSKFGKKKENGHHANEEKEKTKDQKSGKGKATSGKPSNQAKKRPIATSPQHEPPVNKKTCEYNNTANEEKSVNGSDIKSSHPTDVTMAESGEEERLPKQQQQQQQQHDNREDNKDGEFEVDKVDNELSVFLSNMLYTADEANIRDFFNTCGEIEKIHIVRNMKGVSKGFAYLQFKQKQSVEKALALDRQMLTNRPLYVSKCTDKKENPTQFQYPTGLDKRTLFVTNLPFEATPEQITEHFTQGGLALKDLRLVTNRSGKARGMAYVEYEAEADATTSLIKFDKEIFMGRPLNVHLSNPPTRKPFNKKDDTSEEGKTNGGGARNKNFKPRGTQEAPPPPGARVKSKTQISLVPRALIPRAVAATATTTKSGEGKDSVPSEKVGETPPQGPMNNSEFRKFLLK